MNRFVTTVIVALSVNLAAHADLFHVYSGDSIQDIIDFAEADDTVLVHPGLYFGCLNLNGKAITLMSSGGPAVTFISGLDNGSVITCEAVAGAEGAKIIDGFTLASGVGTGSSYCDGGAIYLNNTSPTIKNCIVLGNTCLGTVTGRGGGLYSAGGGSPTIVNCIFDGNRVTNGSGGAIYTSGGSPKVINCTFVANSVTGDAGQGGAIHVASGDLTVVNSILWGNTAADGQQLSVSGTGTASVTYNCIEGGWTGEGNIATVPHFVDADGADDQAGTGDDDLHLRSDSRCVDSGRAAAIPSDITTDYEGDSRVQQAEVDMGADETPHAADCNGNGVFDAIEMAPLTGHALWFDGVDDYVDPGASTALADLGQGDFAIEAWVWTEDTGHSILIGNAGGVSRLWNFVIRGHEYGGVIALRIKDGVSEWSCLGETSVTDGRWHHVAAVRWIEDAGGLVAVYVDGEIDAWGWPEIGPFTADNETLIGRDQQSSPHYFNGVLDEVRVWSVGRDESEIVANMYNRLDGTEPGLAAYWRFDEGAGSIAYDTAGTSDGTLVGSTAWLATRADCNGNEIPDDCDVANGTSPDCNGNGAPDECDVADGTSPDCNTNGVPDECDIADGTSLDCNENGVPDMCDVRDGTSPDCNMNGVPDECDIASGTSPDCNANGVPDECDVASGTTPDCNENGVPDACDIADGTSPDCNGNGIPDECEVGGTEDCNTNGISDLCDIYSGTSLDCNGNGIPDECETMPVGVIYVDDDATSGLNDGSSWADAYLDVQDALTHAACSDLITEIHVAGGTYKPGTARSDAFHLVNGVALRGGYRGLADGGDPNDRDITGFKTIFHGDRLGNDRPDVQSSYHDNYVRLVVGVNVNASAVLEGVTIAWACDTLAGEFGAGVYLDHASPTITQCDIRSNRVLCGGGVYCFEYCNPKLINCLIYDNYVVREGGAMYNLRHNNPTLINCTIVSNSGYDDKGGIYSSWDCHVTLTNCILWGNEPPQIYDGTESHTTVTYSCVQGDWGGTGNIDVDPLLDGDHVHLLPDSPCINAGRNAAVPSSVTTDFEGEDRIQHCRVDMGADETPYFHDDCNNNGVADQCEVGGETDCNGNGTPDLCDIYDGTSQDCNENGVPDDCEVGGTKDCNENGVPDLCDIHNGTSPDCNENGVPDECEIGGLEDCNENGIPDLCDIYDGTSVDCSANGVPDECEPTPIGVLYVDDDATSGQENGASWADAHLDLQDALAHAECHGQITEIRVAGGTYVPGTSYNATFELRNGLALRGGYRGLAGGGEADDRDIDAFPSILSGEIRDPNDPYDNCHRVVQGLDVDASAVIEGFTITAGSSNYENGAGVRLRHASPTISHCRIVANSATNGGGVYMEGYSSPTLINCTFSDNEASEDGGAMCSTDNSSPTLTNCTFSNNDADDDGGAMYTSRSNPTLINCTFNDNDARDDGGAMEISSSNPTLINCTFSDNVAGDGGAMSTHSSNPTLINCTFSNNDTRSEGGAMFNVFSGDRTLINCTIVGNSADHGPGGIFNCESAHVKLTNCVLWGNEGGQILNDTEDDRATVTHSCVQGGWDGVGNIDVDPLLDDDGVHLLPDSPCVNAGDDAAIPSDVTTDYEGEDRIQQCRVDMGADESPHFGKDCNSNDVPDACDIAACDGSPWCGDCNGNGVPDECDIAAGTSQDDDGDGVPDECLPYGDCDHDLDVDLDDLNDMLSCWFGPDLEPGGDCDCFDTDADADVDLADFALFQQAFTGSQP